MRLVLVRHGETAWNAQRRLQGQQDISLSERGRADALALRGAVAALGAEHAVSSPLARARDTAAALGLDPVLDPRLMEAYLGEWEGELSADLAGVPNTRYWEWRVGGYTPPGGESFQELQGRVVAALTELADAHEGTVVAVTHGGVVRAAIDALCHIAPDQITPAASPSLTALVRERRGAWRLGAYNVTADRLDVAPSD